MKKIIAYVHTHWDREWYREFEEFRLRLIEVVDEILSMLVNEELPCFYFDGQTAAIEDYLEIHPEKSGVIKELVKQKKLRIGPFYCSADSFLVSGESLYRNFEMGIKKSKEFGETDFIGYMSDTFGHSRCMPYILKALGINKACLWRGLGDLPADLIWDGIDVTYLIQGYFQDFLSSNLTKEKKYEFLKQYIDKIALKSGDTVLLPIGADHLAAAKNISAQLKDLEIEAQIATPFEYFDSVAERQKVDGEFLNNKLNFILPGVYSSRNYIKQANAKSQWLLTRMAEPLQAISHHYFNTPDKQREIDYAYKTLIKNHAHDSIYGCSIDKVHDEVMTRFEKVDSVSNGIIKRTIRDLSSDDAPFVIINLSNFNYSGAVKFETEKELPAWLGAVKISSRCGFSDKKLYNINEIPVTEDIVEINTYLVDVKNLDSFSLTQITKDNVCIERNIVSTDSSIENKYIKVEIKDKKIVVTDKQNNEVYDDFINITDRKDDGDSYNFGAVKDDVPLISKVCDYSIKECNDIRAILSVKFDFDIEMDLILYNQAKYLEFDMKFENKRKNHILQMGFNLKEKIYSTVNEDLYGITVREFDPDYDIYGEIPAKRGVELKPNTSPMQRFMQTQNFALFTKGLSEYEILKNTLNLTLLRSTGIISNPKNPTRGTPAGPPLETEKLQCLGDNYANFAIAFEKEENSLFKLAEEFYAPFIGLFTQHKTTKFFPNNIDNLAVHAVKTENDALLFRVFDKLNREIKNIIT